MRYFFLVLCMALTAGLCFVLDTRSVLKVPLGRLLSPQEGLWQQAEPLDMDYSGSLRLQGLKGAVDVYLDERLVPHVFADHEQDLYYAQGYLHARFRLFQMEMQTRYAAGRLAEVLGPSLIEHDRRFRRSGITFAAENCLAEIRKDPQSLAACEAYTKGVNEYIRSLTRGTMPVEYQLLGLAPESWSELKSALFLKNMSFVLSGYEQDFESDVARSYFSRDQFGRLFPESDIWSDPVVPRASSYLPASISPQTPASADSLYFRFRADTARKAVPVEKPDPSNGSNNWVMGPSKTLSGAPILCNDPHLSLQLPSYWFEMQLNAPGINSYGVTFPGAPGIIIGFNDQCAFGFTNAGRDVKDYFQVRFKDKDRSYYYFDSTWMLAGRRVERIRVAGGADVYDTVSYTHFGPVLYDASFPAPSGFDSISYALRWTAHDPSNEFRFFYLINRSRSYGDFVQAVQYLGNPGQNCIFASKDGDIALREGGVYPAKWKGQGDFPMPGADSTYFWQGMIPESETPFQLNPDRGFVSSANQRPADTSYPYYLGRGYPTFRGMGINRRLAAMNQVTPRQMMSLQTSNYNYFAESALPLLLAQIRTDSFNIPEKKMYEKLKGWNRMNQADSEGATVFEVTWKTLHDTLYADEFEKAPAGIRRPQHATLLQALLTDSAYAFTDNRKTARIESLSDIATLAFTAAVHELKQLESEGKLTWSRYKNTHIDHLLRLPSLSKTYIQTGGHLHSVNAMKDRHGPGWRMVVSLTAQTEAYGVCAGGQSGNPGSRFYDDGLNTWASGYYFDLHLLSRQQRSHPSVKWRLRLTSKS